LNFTYSKELKILHKAQTFNKTDEKNIVIVPCKPDEPVCRDNTGHFCFFLCHLFF